jgi:type IV pilus assembly protein PilA
MGREWGTEKGFSIVELLVVGAIFGILALIAVPQYSMYRERSYKTAAANDLRNVALAQETFFARNAKYFAMSNCSQVDALSQCSIEGLPGIARLSKGVNMRIETTEAGFKAEARHANSNLVCRWDSTQGGMLGCHKDKHKE